jgi:hypothetical protein
MASFCLGNTMSHFGTDTKVTYGFDPVCDWYTKYVVYDKNGEKWVDKYHLTYYYDSTRIPNVSRKNDKI